MRCSGSYRAASIAALAASAGFVAGRTTAPAPVETVRTETLERVVTVVKKEFVEKERVVTRRIRTEAGRTEIVEREESRQRASTASFSASGDVGRVEARAEPAKGLGLTVGVLGGYDISTGSPEVGLQVQKDVGRVTIGVYGRTHTDAFDPAVGVTAGFRF